MDIIEKQIIDIMHTTMVRYMSDRRVYELALIAIDISKNDVIIDCLRVRNLHHGNVSYCNYEFLLHLEQLQNVCNDHLSGHSNCTYPWYTLDGNYDSATIFGDIIDYIKYEIVRGTNGATDATRRFIEVGKYSQMTWNLCKEAEANYYVLFLRIKLLLAVEYQYIDGIRAIMDHEMEYIKKNPEYQPTDHIRTVVDKICIAPVSCRELMDELLVAMR